MTSSERLKGPAVVPLNDLRRDFAAQRELLGPVVESALASGWYVLGPQVGSFEEEFASYCGASRCVGVASGTDALELALRSVGVGPGGEVITAANAGGYTTTAVLAAGALPRFADVDGDTHLLTAERIAPLLTSRSSAIVVTHLYGRLADDIDAIVALGAKTGVPVIEDCAQAAGASRNGRRAGSFGTAAAFSFYPTKNLGALGDGGAVTTSDQQIADEVRQRRQYGWRVRYLSELGGGRNSRLDEVQAAVLRARLPLLDRWNGRRRQIVRRYEEALPPQIGVFSAGKTEDYVGHLAVVKLHVDRDDFRAFMKERGIATDVHYPVPDYRQPVVAANDDHDVRATPNTEDLARRIVTLPCFPELTEDEISRVCTALVDSTKLA